MTIFFTPSTIVPIRIAAIGLPVLAGDDDDGEDVGIKRAVEQANWSAANRPDVHYNMHFGRDGWGGGNEIRTIPMTVPAVEELKLNTDIRVGGDSPIIRFGQELNVAALTSVRLTYSLTDESLNNHTFPVNIPNGGPGDGSEQQTDIDVAAVGLNFNEWINVQMLLRFVLGFGASQVNSLRCVDVATSGTPYEPPDE